jgi:hypothetical protein
MVALSSGAYVANAPVNPISGIGSKDLNLKQVPYKSAFGLTTQLRLAKINYFYSMAYLRSSLQ